MMAPSAPWIVNSLIEALHLYLLSEPVTDLQSQADDLPFDYKHDNSNLSIAVRGRHDFTLCLLKWQASRSGRVIEAHVTDGDIGIQATFPREALLPELSPTARPQDSALRTTLKLRRFEIRLASCFEPPRVTLYLQEFDISSTDDIVNTCDLPTIHNYQLASQHLATWKRSQNEWILMKPSGSPLGVRSQAGDLEDRECDSDTVNQDPIPTSQARYATQIPMKESLHKSRVDIHKKTRNQNAQREKFSKPATHPTKNSLLDLLANKTSVHIEDVEASNHAPSTVPDLTQQQIVTPPSSKPVEEPDNTEGEGDVVVHVAVSEGNKKQPPGLVSSAVEPMPNAIIELLRHWRNECHSGRHIPRQLQTVPKDQVKLLESDDCWQPPLVGHTQRLGAVPLSLLKRLTHSADSEYTQAPANVQEPQTMDRNDQRCQTDNMNEEQDGSVTSSQATSEASEEIPWSPSPPRGPRAQKELPPDSSPPQPFNVRGIDTKKSHSFSVDELVDNAMEQISTSLKGCSNNPPSDLPDYEDDSDHIDSLYEGSTSRDRADEMLPSLSALESSQRIMTTETTDQTVHVKRTPFPVKGVSSPANTPDSSTNFIPGTFNERHISKRTDTRKNSTAATGFACKVTSTDHSNSLEAVSSKVETNVKESELATDDYDLPMMPVIDKKRKVDDQNLMFRKRCRKDKNDAGETIVRDSDYRLIDEDRAQYRREYFSTIVTELGLSSMNKPQSRTGTSNCQTSAHWETGASDSSSSRQQDKNETSDTCLSVHRNAGRSGVASTLLRSVSVPCELEIRILPKLYQAFTSAYPDYGGQQKHFDAACQLLGKLHTQGKATHPSLWDDFVFHHFDSYRDHLRDVMENCGSALPYEIFYDECIEQPTCLLRVIRPALLNNALASVPRHVLPSIADTFQPDTLLDGKPNIFAALNKSVAADSSVSNVCASTEPQLRERQSISPPARVFKAAADATREGPDTKRTLSQEQSQDSRISVNVWLERTAGAESPILGTPEVLDIEVADVLVLDLTQEEVKFPTPQKAPQEQQKKPRSLPWGSSVGGRTPSKSDQVAKSNAGKVAVDKPVTHHKKGRGADRSKKALKSPALPSKTWTKYKPKDTFRIADVETEFTRFVRLYNELPGERVATRNLERRSAGSVDIHAWRI